MAAHGSIIANTTGFMRDRLQRMFPWAYALSTKHNYGKDYGWPEQLGFDQFYRMYCRSGLAAAAVDKTIGKTWQTTPALWESEEPAESPAEEAIRKHFAKRKIWRAFMDADRRSMVGEYAGAIILLRDGKQMAEPVDRVARGIENVVGIIPAWQGQLTVDEWDDDQTSDTYGEPLWFQFDEQAVGDPQNAKKSQVRVHRDRMLVWSDDGTLNCRSALEPGYNDVSDAEKIKGAGGEGFWKSARGAPVVETREGVSLQDMITGAGVKTQDELRDKLNEKADDFQSGFDKFLMLGGFTAKPMTITLPQPKEFWEPCVQSFAASMGIPFKVLIGNVTGERASTEDAEEWAQTCMSRRENRVLSILYEFIERLVAWGVLEKRDWTIGWQSLLEDSPDDKLGRAEKMSKINQTLGAEPAFLPDEIREAAGFKPSDEIEGFDEFLAEREERARQVAEDGPVEDEPDDDEARQTASNAKAIPLYVRRKLLNADDLIRWAKSQGFKVTLDATDMHVTILYSRTAVDPIKMGETWSGNEKGELAIKPGGPRAVEKLGEEAVVLLFASDDLSWRHRAMVEAGASHDYDEYQPHVTITYEPGNVDLDKVKPFTGELRFGLELFEPINPDWKPKVTEE